MKDLAILTNDTLLFECSCGCQIVRLFKVDDVNDLYAMEFYTTGNTKIKFRKKREKLANDLLLTGEQLTQMFEAFKQLKWEGE